MTRKEVKENIIKSLKKSFDIPPPTGGQTCGMPRHPIILTSEELGISIKINHHKSQIRDYELAYMMFDLIIDDLIK